jgi:leucyl aminopeptidase (aminopeptidase T)
MKDESFDEGLALAAEIAVGDVLGLKKGEQALIISNPEPDVSRISEALYCAAEKAGARPVLLFQPVKTQFDFAEPAVLAAFRARPDVVISISAGKLGKDREGIASPYKKGGETWNHIFHFLMYGEKSCRSFWSPHTTVESFVRTVPIDYGLLARRAAAVKKILDSGTRLHITAPGGTSIWFGISGRAAKTDDGRFSLPGSGGNLPAGEAYISPENGTGRGVIVFDGSISLEAGDILVDTPIVCAVEDGFVREISGGREAAALLETVSGAEERAAAFEKSGQLPPGAGAVYGRNARNIGEIGIGLNPAAKITGAMLEDEKAFETCHFAIGENYDGDAPALIHLDGLVRRPTITVYSEDGSAVTIEKDGKLLL